MCSKINVKYGLFYIILFYKNFFLYKNVEAKFKNITQAESQLRTF